MINKKAQGFSTTELLVTVAVIATVVIVGIGVFGGFDSLFSKIGLLPDNAESYATLCSSYKAMPDTYCSIGGGFKEVRLYGVTQRVNCEYLAEKGFKFDAMADPCPDITAAAKATCLNSKLKPTYMINDKTCAQWNSTAVITSTAVTGSCVNINDAICDNLDSKQCPAYSPVCLWGASPDTNYEIKCSLGTNAGKSGCATLSANECQKPLYGSLCKLA